MRQPHFIFTFDGVFALVAGLLFITLAPQLTSLLGWPLPASTLAVIGVVLLPWGLFNFWSARSWPLSTAAFMAHVVVDVGWVLASLSLVLSYRDSLSALGIGLLLGQTVSVGGVFAFKCLARWPRTARVAT